MSDAYSVKPSEIRGLTPDARTSLAAWVARVNASNRRAEGHCGPLVMPEGVTRDIAPAVADVPAVRLPLPRVVVFPAWLASRVDLPGTPKAIEQIAADVVAVVETQGWETVTPLIVGRPEQTIIRWTDGEARLRADGTGAEKVITAYTKPPKAQKAAPAPKAPRAKSSRKAPAAPAGVTAPAGRTDAAPTHRVLCTGLLVGQTCRTDGPAFPTWANLVGRMARAA